MFNQRELNQLYRYALAISRQEDVAYDLLQTALERYLTQKNKAGFNGASTNQGSIEKPMAYLKTVIRNAYIDFERRKKVVEMVPLDNMDSVVDIELVESGMEDVLFNQQQIEILISTLSNDESELLYLWAVEEHTASEIASIYQVSRGTILSRLHRLKLRIRQQYLSHEELSIV